MRPPGGDNGGENAGSSSYKNDGSCSFIHMVHHLIERCLLFHMDRDECVKALAKHAGIEPIITLTVWKELQKANEVFFRNYVSLTMERKSKNFRRYPDEDTVKSKVHNLDACCDAKRMGYKSHIRVHLRRP